MQTRSQSRALAKIQALKRKETQPTIHAKGLYFRFERGACLALQLQASNAVKKISDQIDALYDELIAHMFKPTDKEILPEEQYYARLDAYLASDKWHEYLSSWESFGLYYRKDETELPQLDKVNILIKRDRLNRTCFFDVSLKTLFLQTHINVDMSQLNELSSDIIRDITHSPKRLA